MICFSFFCFKPHLLALFDWISDIRVLKIKVQYVFIELFDLKQHLIPRDMTPLKT